MDLALLRNLGIAAHIDAGKTTVSEHILHCAGVEHRAGEVDAGTTVLDWLPEERERGITISSAATTIPWRGNAITLIDTPGHVDFTVEVERCMRVLDGAILVLDAVAGVQAQSETVWRQIVQHQIPALAFVNKCDRVGADFHAALMSLRTRLGIHPLALQTPIFREGRFEGVVDLLSRKAYCGDTKDQQRELLIPAELRDEVELLRSELLETAANFDERVLECVLEEREPALVDLQRAVRKATLSRHLVPVLAGAALRGIGIALLLDAVVDYLPSPLDRPPVCGYDEQGKLSLPRLAQSDAPLLALAFKLQSSSYGDLTFVRIYAGTLRPGEKLWNPRVGRMERPLRVLRLHGEGVTALDSAGPGEIVGLAGLKFTVTGDTLCDRAHSLLLEPPRFPEPVISIVLEPANADERDRLRAALLRITHEDPSLRLREDEALGQWCLEGMGELHLEVARHRLQREFRLEPRVGNPRVSYREALRSSADGRVVIHKVVGGCEVFGAVELQLEPLGEGETTTIQWEESCKLPAAFRPAVELVLRAQAASGPRFGFPLMPCRIRLIAGESRPTVDSESAYLQAAVAAFRQALTKAEIALLEPLMSFQLDTPEGFSSGLLADLASRAAEVESVAAGPGTLTIRGRVPLQGMFGYSTVVRSLSQGRASFILAPAGFRQVQERHLVARGLSGS